MRNVSEHAQWHAKFIAYLVEYLEGKLSGLTDQECETLQAMIDNPPDHIPPEERASYVFVELTALLSKADEYDWALARAMVEERSRRLPA